MDLTYEKLISSYLAWLKSKITVKEINGLAEITTPFLDRHNDHLQLYVKRTEEGFILTDDGYILTDLEMSSWEANTPRRKEMLNITLNGFGVDCVNNELQVKSTVDDFPRKKHALLQAMMAVNDMAITSRHNVLSLFVEDVENYFNMHNVRYVPNAQFSGKSGFNHKFDFVIPKSKDIPERIVRAVNSITRDNSSALIFAWADTREIRLKESDFYVIINDMDKTPSAEAVEALTRYSIKPVLWSERDKYIDKFIA